MCSGESGAYETRLRTKVSRKTDATHTTTVSVEVDLRGESVNGRGSRKMAIIIETEELLVESWVISKDFCGIVINVESSSGRFNNDAFFGVGEDPVEFGKG